jgi:hypothetical protein
MLLLRLGRPRATRAQVFPFLLFEVTDSPRTAPTRAAQPPTIQRVSMHPSLAQIEARMRAYLAEAELRQPDAVRVDPQSGALRFVWKRENVVLTVQREPSGAHSMRLRPG